MASTTKIMTAILLLEYGNLEREITATKEMVTVEGTAMGLLEGDRVTLNDLLYGLLLQSGNDSANAIAISVAGSLDKFCDMMNGKAKELGLKDTHFETPSGLDSDGHYTTAYELALITKYAFSFEEFEKAVSAEKKTVCFGNPPYNRTLSNHNKLLNTYDDVVGVKTGYTKKSGRCLVSASKKDGKFIIAVTLNDRDDWKDHRTLLDIGLASVNNVTVCTDDSAYVSVVGGKKNEIAIKPITKCVCTADSSILSASVYVSGFLYAPVKVGETIGRAVYYCGNEIKYDEIITADTKIPKTNVSKFRLFLEITHLIIRSINER